MFSTKWGCNKRFLVLTYISFVTILCCKDISYYIEEIYKLRRIIC